MVVNLMTKAGETDDWGARRHVDELAQRAGRAPDAVLVHAGGFARARLRDYAREGAMPVVDDLGANGEVPFRVVRADLASAGALIHHDPGRHRARARANSCTAPRGCGGPRERAERRRSARPVSAASRRCPSRPTIARARSRISRSGSSGAAFATTARSSTG